MAVVCEIFALLGGTGSCSYSGSRPLKMGGGSEIVQLLFVRPMC